MTSEERIQLLINLRGYVVLCTRSPQKIGCTFNRIKGKMGGELSQPLYIIKETTYEDAEEQTKILAKYGENSVTFFWPYYYRVSTD